MKYEFIREIFNSCSGNQMRDVFFEDVETNDIEAYVSRFLVGNSISFDKNLLGDGSTVFDVDIDGLKQRFTFTPAD